VVAGGYAIEPRRVGIGTRLNKHIPCADPAAVAALADGHVECFQCTICRTRQSCDGGLETASRILGVALRSYRSGSGLEHRGPTSGRQVVPGAHVRLETAAWPRIIASSYENESRPRSSVASIVAAHK